MVYRNMGTIQNIGRFDANIEGFVADIGGIIGIIALVVDRVSNSVTRRLLR